MQIWKKSQPEVPIHGSRVAMLRGSRAARRGRCGRFDKLQGKEKKKEEKRKKICGISKNAENGGHHSPNRPKLYSALNVHIVQEQPGRSKTKYEAVWRQSYLRCILIPMLIQSHKNEPLKLILMGGLGQAVLEDHISWRWGQIASV